VSWRLLHGFLLPYLGVYGPLGRVGPKYLPGRARLAAPVLAVRPPGGTTQRPSGTTAADAQAAINSLPRIKNAGNNGPVSTARASSFLNAAGTMGGVTISERIEAGRRERRVLVRVSRAAWRLEQARSILICRAGRGCGSNEIDPTGPASGDCGRRVVQPHPDAAERSGRGECHGTDGDR
jgi:hypothetical protein